MRVSRLPAGLLLIALLALPLGSALTPPVTDAPDGATRLFVSDDRDPNAGAIPPFVLSEIDDVVQTEDSTMANVSRMRDFYYATTQPPYRVGPANQTLSEYRRAQLRSIHRNESTSLWLPDSQRSNGTVVTDAHITLLGTLEGTHTRLGTAGETRSETGSELLLIPRTGTVITHLDYSTRLPNRTCTVAGDTKTCRNYTLLDQRVNRTVQIGSQTWSSNSETPQQLEYAGATATEPATMQVRATINTTVAVQTSTYVRGRDGWQLSNTSTNETLTLSHTVQDTARVVITTNQNLSVTQTVVRSEDGIDRIILRFEGPQTLSDRRLWSYARFQDSTGRVENIWGVYSQRQYANATRGYRLRNRLNTTLSPSTTITNRPNRTRTRQSTVTGTHDQTVSFPNVLELQLAARSRQPTLRWTGKRGVVSAPKISRTRGFNLSATPAPLDRHVNLTSVPPRGYRTIVVTNVDQPITAVHDIHNDSIPVRTQTVRERNATLSTKTLNETHARIQLTDTATGHPLAGRTLWLSGAATGRVTTNADGVAIVERRDLYVTASFSGSTNVSESAYYGSAQTQVVFQPEPFNIYQLLRSLAGALVSIAAFFVFFLPFAYMRRRKS
ncbi:hypothetical protein [Halomicrococcus sp. NG-SE-24]|uniref:hypothetical protein n=1 Tax=Halomicrococcus sp. NG-SE-24 TaxID=3436928 RepID=UPI003D98C3E3